MAAFVHEYTVDLKKSNKRVCYMGEVLYEGDSLADVLSITVLDSGAPATLSGTVAGKAVVSNGDTIAIDNGSFSGNVVTISLPAAAYVTGPVKITVSITSGTTTTTLFGCVAVVIDTTTDNVVDPGTIIPSIESLIAEIEDARDSLPPTYTALLASIAPDYSTSSAYSVGAYVWHDGTLYRCTTAIATGETWTAGHWTAAVLGDDTSALKSALLKDLIVQSVSSNKASINSSGEIIDASGGAADYAVYCAPVKKGAVCFVTHNNVSGNLICAFYSGNTAPIVGSVSYDGSRVVQASNVVVAPIDGWIAFRSIQNDSNVAVSYVEAVDAIARESIDAIDAITRESIDAIDLNLETVIKLSLSEQAMPISTIGLVRRSAIAISSKTIGTDYGSDYYLSNPIPVTSGELYKISCSSYGTTAAYAFANENGIQTVYPATASGSVHLVDNEIIRIPENINILYLSRYGTASSAVIPIAISKYVSNDVPDNNAIKTYLGNFEQNKAENIEWLDGYAVLAIDTSRPRTDNMNEIASFSVNRGDLIIITYQADHPLNSGRIALSEKITYGSDALKYGFRPIIRRGTDTIAYVAEKNMDVTVCGEYGHLPSVKCYSSKAYAESSDFASDRYKQFDYNKVTQKLSISKRSRNNYNDTTDPKPLTLLHFSDIHNNFVNASNIKRFLEMYKGSDIDDAICTGDMSASNFHDYKPIYSLEGYKNIMLCIGNHDVYDADGSHGSDSEQYWATNAQKYSQYFAPSVSDWNVTQPTGAAENGLCYYYKDYTSNNYGYRLIVLDAMAFDDAQYNWFVATLADAKTNSKTVVIAEHFAPITGLSDINGFDTPFMSMLTGMEYNYAVSRLSTTAGSAVNAVDAFIADGGEFACWLCGHMHYDQIGTLVSHPNQIFIAIASANKSAVWLDMPRTLDTESADLFNIVSIDPKLKMIKIERIGATVDDWGRMHDHVSINYATKTLIATS